MKGLWRWPTKSSTSSHILYGDLLNVLLYSLILPLAIVETIDRTWTPLLPQTESSISYLDDVNLETIRLRLYVQLVCPATSVICHAIAFYNSCSETTRIQGHSRKTVWCSCVGFLAMISSCAALSINNLSHPEVPTLPGHFCWDLVVATANLSHSFRVKLFYGGSNLFMGLVVVYCVPHIYPWTIYVPLLVGITGT
jgi:hypothetical protein